MSTPTTAPLRPLGALASGLFSTALALLLVYVLSWDADFDLMSWYLWWIFPIGSIAVGLLAAVGYGIGARLLHVKVTRPMLAAIVALQTLAYVIAVYVSFEAVLETLHPEVAGQIGFLTYFDLTTRSFSFDGGSGMGGWGYAFRALEFAGFVGGSLIVPWAVGVRAYCEDCRTYYRDRGLGFAALGHDDDETRLAALYQALQDQDLRAFGAWMRGPEVYPQDHKDLGARLSLWLWHCPDCHQGHIDGTVLVGHGENTSRTVIGHWTLGPAFVGPLVAPQPRPPGPPTEPESAEASVDAGPA